ncbi:hypothetical protein EW026_g4735 [Hermanssonia centrifuga]|uniref:Peroxisomal ATPase PEX1 n=1 Tax=Hermanssonia centrifuga TaxID=98765 RepID=A0A4S4KG85_9APHY|nr:hypothetical protein EW026_g4735 [Hermanssonia centrifuga]
MVGQEIDVWVLGRTRVRLRVVSVDPPSSGKALLLTTSTEVSIAPKTRSQNKLSGSSSHSAVSSKKVQADAKGAADANVNAQAKDDEGRKKKDVRFLRHLPPRVMPPVSPTAAAVEDGSIFAIGFVSRVLLNALSGTPLYAEPKTWTATVRRIPPPPDPLQEDRAGAASAPAAPRILNPTDPNAPKASSVADEPIQRDRILVTWWPEVEVPDDHIVLHGSVGGIEEWDIVRVEFEKEIDEVVTVEQSDTRSEKQTKPRAKLAGVDDIMKDCNDFCRTTFIIHANTQKRINGVPGLLITGRSGSGKTSMLRAVAKASQESPLTYTYTLYVDLAKYTDTPVSRIKGLLKYWFTKASWHKPSVIVMDNLDKLMSVELEHAESFRTRHITELFLNLFGSANRFAAPNARGILLLASAESTAAIHPRLNTAHVFREVIHLKPPGKDARRDILANIAQTHIDASDLTQDPSSPLNFTALATQTEGFSATDLKDLVARAVHRAAIRVAENEHDKTYQPTLRTEDFTAAQMDFVPLSLRDVKLQKSDIAWSDIGGLYRLLLYGFPGCGKTLLASAVAKECGLNFISVKGPELLNKYIGASEQSVRELFERASAAKPCVLFFDEFDSIAPKRGHDSTGVTDRVVNQMLTQMDGAEGLDGVYVLAATSRPDLIDSALLRPGRLDKSLLCNMPDEQDRKEILEAVSRKVSLSPSINLDETARDTEGFSGADLQALIYNAQLEVIHETIASTSLSSPSKANGESSEDKPIPYTMIGGPDSGQQVKSRAEEAAFQKRVRKSMPRIIATMLIVMYDSFNESYQIRRGLTPEQNVSKTLLPMRSAKFRKLTFGKYWRQLALLCPLRNGID